MARDDQEALQALKETLPDLVILDITLSKLGGFEVCRRLRHKLGDDAASSKYIRTESGVRYRFLDSP